MIKLVAVLLACLLPQEPLGEYWGTAEEEAKYYQMVDLELPESLAIEAGSFEVMPDNRQLAVATRRGDIFLVDGAFDEHPELKFHKFASGLDEVFGMAYRDGSFWVTQQSEVTRITDTDGDLQADLFQTLSDRWGFRDYHEFAFGSKPDDQGNIWVALCLSKSYHSEAPFRGWCLKVTPDGKTIPVCSGIRSPCGIGPNEHGVMFYCESQGPWNGSCSLKVLQPGGFMGHPISFNWYPLAPELGPAPVLPNTPSRLETERKRVKELVPYAVVFPYIRMGRSISGFMVDRTGGKFGPFENQIFVADFSLGVIMRATTEQVNGVWQGACYPFREGFATGLLAVQFTPNGSLIAGGTNRGWPVRGPKAYAMQRLDWTGKVPFEIKTISARPKGFAIQFTQPVDPETASVAANYKLATFTHIYQQGYGSPEVDQTAPVVTQVDIAPDRLSVNVEVQGLVQGHVHDFNLANIKSATGQSLLHASAFYTLNEIPKDSCQEVFNRSQPPTPAAVDPKDSDLPSYVSTKGIIDFQKPQDAIDLVNESQSLLIGETSRASQWSFEDGVLVASPTWDSVVTPDAYRDFRLHVEFNVNDSGDEDRERNGNSGIYLQQRYEIQILNSFGVALENLENWDCGSIYRRKKPDQLASLPAGQWQSFDIAFRAARFIDGKRSEPARLTVYHNERLIHDDVALPGKTGVGKQEENSDRPILLQGHHNQVQFRNIWIQKLNLSDKDAPPESIPQITVSHKELPTRGEAFQLNGHDAFVLLPKERPRNQLIPWVWYAPTLNGLPAQSEMWMFQQFLDAGVAVAGIDVGESYGSPSGRQDYQRFYDYLTTSRQFQPKPALLARSRGGLMLYNWAADHPDLVSAIAGIYPVCNVASYPGIQNACAAYSMSPEELELHLAEHNPVDRLQGLADEAVPLFHIHVDNDQVVPLQENSLLVQQRYQALGGSMTLEVPAGRGHDMWDGWFQSQQLVDFVLTHLGRPLRRHPVPESEQWLTFTGEEGPGKGKHIVLIAAEQEYRSEVALPMLAKMLATHHGFDCTVLFSVNENGEVDPTLPAPLEKDSSVQHHHIPGLEYLAKADGLIWMSRFMQLKDEDLKHFHDYFDSGKPIVALRTANHGLWGPTRYFKGEQKVDLRQLLGGTFQKHHGGWHHEATTGIIVDQQASHPILRGIDDIWGPSDVYQCHDERSPFPEDCTALLLGQPMQSLDRNAGPNENKKPLPIAWIKTWVGNQEKPSRIFHFTMGSAKDFECEDVRRIVVNAIYWGLEMEAEIDPNRSVSPVDVYEPPKSGFNYEDLGVRPRKPSQLIGKQ